ncbi:hypothetical protein M8994_11670 [Brucella sp. 21LCYQ03]|nr:hypothetical protein [Brucella sp. 21LCYQ03]
MRTVIIHYRRECWVTPDGKTILAPLPILKPATIFDVADTAITQRCAD